MYFNVPALYSIIIVKSSLTHAIIPQVHNQSHLLPLCAVQNAWFITYQMAFWIQKKTDGQFRLTETSIGFDKLPYLDKSISLYISKYNKICNVIYTCIHTHRWSYFNISSQYLIKWYRQINKLSQKIKLVQKLQIYFSLGIN